jgi:hypothetical protein
VLFWRIINSLEKYEFRIILVGISTQSMTPEPDTGILIGRRAGFLVYSSSLYNVCLLAEQSIFYVANARRVAR